MLFGAYTFITKPFSRQRKNDHKFSIFINVINKFGQLFHKEVIPTNKLKILLRRITQNLLSKTSYSVLFPKSSLGFSFFRFPSVSHSIIYAFGSLPCRA